MKMNDRIILYADGQMSPDEKSKFETELENSEELKKQLKLYRDFIQSVNNLKEIETDDSYFANMIPEFRSRLEENKLKNYHPVYSFASAVITVVLVILFLVPQGKVVNNNSEFSENISRDEVTQYLSNADDQAILDDIPETVDSQMDSVISGILYSNLSQELDSKTVASLYNDIDYNSIVQSIDENEADLIYKEMINKKIY